MIAASTAFSRPAATASVPSKSKTGWAFQPLPNLNRETRQAIGRLRAGWTFAVICTELGYAVHKGRATWDAPRLGIGLKAIARESGQSIGKVRRDVAALAELGLVVKHQPNILHTADPGTGRIVHKAAGRCESTLIYLTITPAVLRPAKVYRGTGGGITVAPPTASGKAHHDTTVREETHTLTGCVFRSENKETPDGRADGVGRPPASAEAGQAAGSTGQATATTEAPTGLPDTSQSRRRLLCSRGTFEAAGGRLTASTGAGRLTAADFEGEGDRQRREQQDRRAGEFAYHLGIEKAAVIELWRADPAGLRRRVIEAGVDPNTGRRMKTASGTASGLTAEALRGLIDTMPTHCDALRRDAERQLAEAEAAGREAVTL